MFTLDTLRPYSVGFEDTFNLLNDLTSRATKTLTNFPPYNIVKINDNKYVIEMAVAGFGKNDIELELKDNSLVISGKVNSSLDTQYLYKGIADRAFTRQFNLADTIEIQDTKLVNGMLKVYLENIIPEHKKPRKIPINTGDNNEGIPKIADQKNN